MSKNRKYNCWGTHADRGSSKYKYRREPYEGEPTLQEARAPKVAEWEDDDDSS